MAKNVKKTKAVIAKERLKKAGLAQARQAAKQRLLNAAAADIGTLYDFFSTSPKGYNEETAEERRDKYGTNEITRAKGDGVFKRIIKSFFTPFTVVLIALALVSLITDVIVKSEAPTTVIIVLAMVFISGVLKFTQETRSGKAAERLSEMVKTTITVQRQEGRAEIPIADIVCGDIIVLAAGDMVPADARIIAAKDMFIAQSSLTGESEPVEKFTVNKNQTKNPLDCTNLAFMGSNVISGSGLALAVNIGDGTMFGSIAQTVAQKKEKSSFEKGVSSVSWLLIRFMAVMVPLVFLVNGIFKGVIWKGGNDAWLEAFLFALSVAVGLTPEMLPMIVTTNLAKGAVNMSKRKVIVKDLNSIQNLGAIDVLCTDKTGTLTQDKIILEYSLDIHGDEDMRVLRHAFLNSYHQTGLKNLMDMAIIDHAGEKEVAGLAENYHKVDEIPFDFNRRRMSVVVADKNGKTQLITKGAIEEMLSVCAYADYRGKVEPITKEIREEILQKVQDYNGDGMRVLGIAHKTSPAPAGAFSVADEKDMVLIGYLAFLDPPKDSSAKAIKAFAEYGVKIMVLTGDNDAVTRCICRQVGMQVDNLLLGSDIEDMTDAELAKAAENTNVFAKLSPAQKARIIKILRGNGHVVGYMGDGINDAPAMKAADVAISVDTAVDIAKESADIILLEKDLMVLENGIIGGRKTYANIIKYIKMTASSNFGNMLSVLVASAVLPFLPMLPLQLLILNLIYDSSCVVAIPWDNVDAEFLRVPRKWDASNIGKFMFWIGPTSSVFDLTTFALMFFIICPAVYGRYNDAATDKTAFAALFQAGWFVESLWSQTLVIHMIRTPKLPFVQSRSSLPLTVMTTLGIAVGTVLPYAFKELLGMKPMPPIYFAYLVATILLYMALATVMKKLFIRKFKELL